MTTANPVLSRAQAIRDRVSGSSVLFGRTLLPSLFHKPPCDMHFEIDNILHNDNIKQAVVIAPRSHAKSTLVSNAHPLNLVLSSGVRGRKEYILIISKTQTLSDELLETIKFHLTFNPKIRATYGDWGESTAKVWTRSRIVLKNDSVIQSRGLGQHIIGLRHHELRPTLILIDDGEDENNTKTKEAMRANLRWLFGAAVPALDPDRGRIFVIGTPKHELCMVMKLIKASGWEKRHYDAIVDEEAHEVLWKEQWPYDALIQKMEEMRSTNELSIFYREYRCQIVGDEEQLFKPEYFQYYEGQEIKDEIGNRYLRITHLTNNDKESRPLEKLKEDEIVNVVGFMGVDPASSLDENAAYTAIMPVLFDDKGRIFIRPYYRKHASPMTAADAVIEYYERNKPEITNLEAVGYQEMLRDYLRQKSLIPGLHKKIVPRNPKSARLERLEPYFAQRKVYFLPGMHELRDELLLYPRAGTNDLMDALELATSRLYPPTSVEYEEKASTKRERQRLREMEQLGETVKSWLTQ